MRIRVTILWAIAALVILSINYSIWQKEQLIARGETIFLQLAPVDPRSFIQGDYMALRYAVVQNLDTQSLPLRGKLVIRRNDNGVAEFARLDDAKTPLAANERLLNYANRSWWISIGAESFFFQEGEAEAYENAKYAELRLAASGETVLIGLRDEALKPLGVQNQ